MRKSDYRQSELGLKPLEVEVTGSFEDAVRRFKSLVQKEKILSKYKEKQVYEKPSDRKRRKAREAKERAYLMKQREQMIQSGEWEKRYLKKQQKRQQKLNSRSTEKND